MRRFCPSTRRNCTCRCRGDETRPRVEARNASLVARIDANLKRGIAPDKSRVYKFDAVFAGLHPQDAAAIIAHDLNQVFGQARVSVRSGQQRVAAGIGQL